MRDCRLLVPEQVSETVSVSPFATYTERNDITYVDFIAMKRYNEEVTFVPRLTPVAYRDSVICFTNSTKRRYRSQTLYETRVRPSRFSDTVIVFPKRPVKSFVTCIDHHIDECRRWFKTSMEFKARTFTTRKVIRDSGGESDTDTEYSSSGESETEVPPPSPGVSQVFLPRWNKDRQTDDSTVPVIGSQILVNGYHN
ncbi:refilin-A-like [Mya arenaria]|uniref:refilin-A-like n=1 Tax=Mya arenaria TaxID=6604 RepID=UPI0022E50324|nr:refilin-A-like [Mya arenaria]